MISGVSLFKFTASNYVGKNNISFKGDENKTFENVEYRVSLPNDWIVPFDVDLKQDKEFNPKDFLEETSKTNVQKQYFKYVNGVYDASEILNNKLAPFLISQLDNLSYHQKEKFIQEYCLQTGFPDLKLVRQFAEHDIFKVAHKLGKNMGFKPVFIGYDKNCSMGRGFAFPGSDCDALFIIIDDSKSSTEYCAQKARWQLKDEINQNLVSTPANSLPEVLSISYIEKGLKLAKDAYYKAGFSVYDLEGFENNLDNSSNDFVAAADFNIRLAELLPEDIATREQYYKTAMFVELYREGAVIESQIPFDLAKEIKNSPLYKYSNIIRQQGLQNSLKKKYVDRKYAIVNFDKMTVEEKFNLIRDIMRNSYGLGDIKNPNLFSNAQSMGNILEMYDLILHKTK
ncbi:MAG: hypothetical protein IJ003_03690 [Candidatus Gastranaerophilales bacterium]|nr:hypothetical protein [Candidatus Gastranaerophilales bacterium]